MMDSNRNGQANTPGNLLRSPILLAVAGIVIIIIIIAVALQGDDQSATRHVGENCSSIDVDSEGTPDLGGCTMRIAVENAYQPFNFINDAGEPDGYDYAIFTELCNHLNCEPEFIEVSWDDMLAIMAGEASMDTFDIGADGITITDERAEHVDFSEPYIQLSQILLIRIDETRFEDAQTLAAVVDAQVGSQTGTTNYDAAVEIVGESRVVAYDQFGQAVTALIDGDIDAVVMDNVAGLGYTASFPDDVKISGQPLTSERLGFILSKDSQLTDAINAGLAMMEADGSLDALFNEWFVDES